MAICISKKRGTEKHCVDTAEFIENWGIKGDAHAGTWHRQISLLPYEKIQDFKKRGAEIADGSFGENLVAEGLEPARLTVGSRLACGRAILEITQIGKECHHGCAIFQKMGDCIMPREGVFLKVLRGGNVRVGTEIKILEPDGDKE